ncbi:MAG: histidine phosphatase family protein [Planctomycetaceae bacterium]
MTPKTLLILRHAKSSWAESGMHDHDRPLNKRGQRDAGRMGQLLTRERLSVATMLSSTAKRARCTAELLQTELDEPPQAHFLNELYHARPEDCMECVAKTCHDEPCVLVIGHNPGLEEWVFDLTGSGVRFVTAALARVEIELESWSLLRAGVRGNMVGLWVPRELGGD